MSRTSLNNWQCSLARTAEILGDKWTLMILRDAFFGLSTFSQFQRNLQVSRNVLSDRLEKLVANGILERTPTRPGVERYHYTLSEAGLELLPLLVTMMQWGDKWIFGSEGEPLLLLDREKRSPVQKVGVQARDGRYLRAQDITPTRGPGAGETLPGTRASRTQGTAGAEQLGRG